MIWASRYPDPTSLANVHLTTRINFGGTGSSLDLLPPALLNEGQYIYLSSSYYQTHIIHLSEFNYNSENLLVTWPVVSSPIFLSEEFAHQGLGNFFHIVALNREQVIKESIAPRVEHSVRIV